MHVPQFSCFVLLVPLSVFLPILRVFSRLHLRGLLPPLPSSNSRLIPCPQRDTCDSDEHLSWFWSFLSAFQQTELENNEFFVWLSSSVTLHHSTIVSSPLALSYFLALFLPFIFPTTPPPPSFPPLERKEVLMTLMVSFKNTVTLGVSNASCLNAHYGQTSSLWVWETFRHISCNSICGSLFHSFPMRRSAVTMAHGSFKTYCKTQSDRRLQEVKNVNVCFEVGSSSKAQLRGNSFSHANLGLHHFSLDSERIVLSISSGFNFFCSKLSH